MDLSFALFDCDVELDTLPGDLAALMAGVALRQAASPTAAAQAQWSAIAAAPLFRPVHGAFNGPMAAAIIAWGKE